DFHWYAPSFDIRLRRLVFVVRFEGERRPTRRVGSRERSVLRAQRRTVRRRALPIDWREALCLVARAVRCGGCQPGTRTCGWVDRRLRRVPATPTLLRGPQTGRLPS